MKARKPAKRPIRLLVLFVLLLSFTLGIAAVSHADGTVQLSESAVKLIEQCEAVFDGNKVVVTDTDDNPDVWSSKLLMDAGLDLTPGEQYIISFSLAGDNGVGEFFLCKSENIDDRYDATFAAEQSDRSIAFTAAQSRVFIGMQVGNLGNGNSVTATVTGLCKLSETANPGLLRTENCTVNIDGSVITATDTNDNNDVWNAKLLYDTGVALEVGKTYKLSFSLEGSNGVGEFFVCKSPDLNDRYDETFVNEAGSKTVTFTARNNKLYIGMQFGNIGNGNSVKLSIAEVKENQKASAPVPQPKPPVANEVLIAENCTYQVESEEAELVITATDTSAETDVWTSKLLLFLGEVMEESRIYAASINLEGENGVGEFFFCKKDNLDDRYSFDDQPGDHTAIFKAEDSKLYAGMQFGNIGEGNEVTATIGDIFRIPGIQTSGENCTETVGKDKITLTDTNDNGDVWDSKAIFDSGIALEPGKEYTATFTLTGDNGVGEFFFLKAADINARYTFDDQPGTHTVSFTAEDSLLYFGIQCGNLGNGNSVTISDITVDAVEPEVEADENNPEENVDTADDSGLAANPEEETEVTETPADEAQPAENNETAAETEAAELETDPEAAGGAADETEAEDEEDDEAEDEDEAEDNADPTDEAEVTENPATENQPVENDETPAPAEEQSEAAAEVEAEGE